MLVTLLFCCYQLYGQQQTKVIQHDSETGFGNPAGAGYFTFGVKTAVIYLEVFV